MRSQRRERKRKPPLVLPSNKEESEGAHFHKIDAMFISYQVSLPFLRFLTARHMSSGSSTTTTMVLEKATAAFPWCCLASLENGSIVTQQNTNDIATDLDVSTSPGWMQWIEQLEDRSHDSGGAGAYDTFRCDLLLGTSKDRWRVWGQDFHLKRLRESYRSIDSCKSPKCIEQAVQVSQEMVQALLQQAQESKLLHDVKLDPLLQKDDQWIQLVRLTLLWSPSHDNSHIIVRGHACSSARPVAIHKPIQPIVVSVAAKQQHDDHHHVNVDTSMPSRLRDPQHKIASWTRLRQQMERPYKPDGVAEVLMLLPLADGKTQVLEGLTSNVFVVYADGTLRTASEGVLYGYARHLVLECAESCGLRYDPSLPVLWEDAEKGLWKEAFITSSSRLIHPIAKVLVKEDEFVEHWSDPVLAEKNDDSQKNGFSRRETPKWQQLHNEILRRGGY